MKQSEICERITERIIGLLEQGVTPWRKSWQGGDFRPARNGFTKRMYSGSNVYLAFLGYSSPDFYSFKQLEKLGARVKKGERGEVITFWKKCIVKDPDGTEKEIPLLRYYIGFNRDQCEGLPPDPDAPVITLNDNDKIKACEALLDEYTDMPPITEGSGACYSPAKDEITIPNIGTFDSSEEYYSALFHEGIHSTGSQNRLNRKHGKRFGDNAYAFEELVAEIGSGYLCGIAGIDNSTIENSAAYIRSWIKHLQDDPRMFFDACRLASKAVEYWRGKDKRTGDDAEDEFSPADREIVISPFITETAPKAAEIIRKPEATAKPAAPVWEQMTLF